LQRFVRLPDFSYLVEEIETIMRPRKHSSGSLLLKILFFPIFLILGWQSQL
jgi:hypothetical protein